ncbi:hypothetical protein, partial [Enterococcus faecalis]|uniref:hypothetical protein n=1 Tax=Enterococcus faecalis TaxID=1351 RepID=UPI00325BF94C
IYLFYNLERSDKMKKINETVAREVKAGFHWHCWLCNAGGGSKAGYLRHVQVYNHIFVSYWR